MVAVFTHSSRGEQIVREGEVGDWMFIVIEGSVQTVDRFGNQAAGNGPNTVLGVRFSDLVVAFVMNLVMLGCTPLRTVLLGPYSVCGPV